MTHAEEATVKEEWLWCDMCKKPIKAYFIDFVKKAGKPDSWALVNPHEHPLRIEICPKTAWLALDFKATRFPTVAELFEALAKKALLKEILTKLDTLARLVKR